MVSLHREPGTSTNHALACNSSYACPAQRYLSDCSGLVGVAWRTLLPFPPPHYFLLPTVATTIACQDLQPGDAGISSNHVQVCHTSSHASLLHPCPLNSRPFLSQPPRRSSSASGAMRQPWSTLPGRWERTGERPIRRSLLDRRRRVRGACICFERQPISIVL